MKLKSLLATVVVAGTAVVTFATSASATALTCYRVRFDDTPQVHVWNVYPPDVEVNDGDPRVESYPC